MIQTTYVHGETEVKLTGRQAAKPGAGGKTITLFEITPVHDYDGSWKKWVNPQTLFKVLPSEEKP
jgi:hypothetical protein